RGQRSRRRSESRDRIQTAVTRRVGIETGQAAPRIGPGRTGGVGEGPARQHQPGRSDLLDRRNSHGAQVSEDPFEHGPRGTTAVPPLAARHEWGEGCLRESGLDQNDPPLPYPLLRLRWEEREKPPGVFASLLTSGRRFDIARG